MRESVRSTLRRPALFLTLVALSLAPLGAQAGSGTDGGFGYTWVDSADGAVAETFTWDVANRFTPGDDDPPMGPISLGFAAGFPFYGNNYNDIWISDNGWISFVAPASAEPVASPIPDPAGPAEMLALAWRDLVVSPGRITHGRNAANDVYRVQFTGFTAGMDVVQVDVNFYSDGRLKFIYAISPLPDATLGIEGTSANDGIQIAHAGMRAPGVNFADGYVLDFLPPAVLPPSCGALPVATCGSTPGMSPVTGPGVLFYGCNTNRWEADEAVYSFTLTEASEVDLTLTTATGLQMFLLSECNERSCLAGPTTATTQLLGAGTYYIAVDGRAAADEGAFTLDILCTPLGLPLSCPGTVAGSNIGGPSRWAAYPCTGGADHGGPEAIYSVQIATATNMRISLDMSSGPADILVLRSANQPVSEAGCVAWGDAGAVVWDAQPGEYLVVVDSPTGSSVDFEISTDCGVSADCSATDGLIDFGAARVHQITGDTTGAANSIEVYACDPSLVLDGGENIFEVVLDAPGQIAISQRLGSPLTYSLLSSCNEGACLSSQDLYSCGTNLPAGTYYLVVDSAAGSETPYEFLAMFEENFSHWSACEASVEMNPPECSPFWNFTDEAFCKYRCADNTSCDPMGAPCADGSECGPNPLALGVDCTWAMYVTVDCGTEMHLPFYDTEGGHVRIFDLFGGEYVQLEGRSPTWVETGDDIQWQDPDCASGSDPRWNEVVTDVSFQRVTGLCGLYRLEFINHSGNVWELFANCDGSRTPSFNICDNLCTALGNYAPLPNLSLVSANETYNCPDVSVTYEVRNDGCTVARNVEVVLRDGADIFTDIIPEIGAGETLMRSFNAMVPTPSTNLEIALDPNDLILECDEPGATGRSACAPISSIDIIDLLGCAATCTVDARGSATPNVICSDGVSPVTLNVCPSVFQACSGLEYAYIEIGSGMMPVFGPDCSWVIDPPPAADTSYSLIARCLDDPDCNDFIRVDVDVQRRPDFDPASVQARDRTNCNLGVLISWDEATFYGPSGSGVYNVYRSETGCDTDLELLRIGITDLEYVDTPPLPDTQYYYVVEAEDDTTMSSCLPRGPTNGGSTTRVSANGGACTPIIDVLAQDLAGLPRIGTSLRVGGTDPMFGVRQYGETFVQMFWTPDRPADPLSEEHYHVYRSNAPDTGFSTISDDAPPISDEEFLDPAADQPNDGTAHVWFYLLVSSDGCEGENIDFERFCTFC